MPINNLHVALINHMLEFVKNEKTCTRQSRASLVREVVGLCSMFEDVDDKKYCKSVLHTHAEKCTLCTILFSSFRYEAKNKKMYFKFDMQVNSDNPNYIWYMRKLIDFCNELNRQILRKVADNEDEEGFSPEQYDSTGPLGEELGYVRMSPEHYFNPSRKSKSQKRVEFTCLVYLTRIKEEYSNFSELQKARLEERFTHTQQKIEQNFSEHTIINQVGDYIQKQLCATPDFSDCSYSIYNTTLQINGWSIGSSKTTTVGSN